MNVRVALSGIVKEWSDLGKALGGSHDDIKVIEANNPKDVKRCLELVVDRWFELGRPSWEDLCKALRHQVVNRKDIGSRIERMLTIVLM